MSAREERRRLGYRVLQRGVPRASIARQLGVSYLTVHTRPSDAGKAAPTPGETFRTAAPSPGSRWPRNDDSSRS
jgi:hypothetical protein